MAKGAVVYLEAAVLLLELLADRNGVRIQVEGVQATLGGQPRENSARMPAAPEGAVHIDAVGLRQDHDPQRFLAHGGRVRAGGLQAAALSCGGGGQRHRRVRHVHSPPAVRPRARVLGAGHAHLCIYLYIYIHIYT